MRTILNEIERRYTPPTISTTSAKPGRRPRRRRVYCRRKLSVLHETARAEGGVQSGEWRVESAAVSPLATRHSSLALQHHYRARHRLAVRQGDERPAHLQRRGPPPGGPM